MKVYKDIMGIALPAMAENVLQFVMGMVDSYLVAHLGLVAISGVAVANNMITIFQALFIALGAAASALLASSLGKGLKEKVVAQATEVLKVTVLVSGVLGILSLVAGRQLLQLLGTEAAVSDSGGTYLILVGGSVVFLGLTTSLGAILRSLGFTSVPMYVSLLSNVLNILFSALAVFGLQLGVVGVAVGTILSRLVACWILWKKLPFALGKLSWGLDRSLLQLALPAAGERLMMRAGDVVVIALIVRLGTTVVAGNAIGETLTQFNYMPALGIATAVVILVAQARGVGDRQRIRDIFQASYRLSLGLMLLIGLFVFFFGNSLVGLYSQNQEVLQASEVVILSVLIGTPATAGTLMYTALWQGLGNARLPFYATTVGMWIIRIGLAAFLTLGMNGGLSGVWLATILDNVFRWGILSGIFRWKYGSH